MMRTGFTVWCTGLSGAGKTTLCEALERELGGRGVSVALLDGDVVRRGLSRGLGFSREDRVEHARRVAAVAALLNAHGVSALVSLISPYAEARQAARAAVPTFLELFVRCSLDTCAHRDPKGLYARALRGELPAFTGVTDPYEAPDNPDLIVDTERFGIDEATAIVLEDLERRGWIPAQGRRQVRVELSAEHFDRVERAARTAGMDGPAEFLSLVAREAALSLEPAPVEEEPDDADDETVLQRLRDLGYID
jgi:adenylylsulfate kinase